jgi:hypothetical protein
MPLQQACIAYLNSITDAQLDEVLPYRNDELVPPFIQTIHDCIRILPFHEGHHSGEVATNRRLQGKKGVA